MRILLVTTLIMILLLASSGNFVLQSNIYGATVTPERTEALEWVQISNGHLVDQSGKRVYLHGINVMTELMPRYSNSPLADSDIQVLKDMRINSVRLALHWSQFEKEFGVYDPAMLAKLDIYVSMFEDAGITVIIDIHSDASSRDLPPYARPMYSLMFNGEAKEGWLNFLSFLAERYKDRGNVIGFDIINEPLIVPSTWNNDILVQLIEAKWREWLKNRYETLEVVDTAFGSKSMRKDSGYNALLLETLNDDEVSFDSIRLPARFLGDSSVPAHTSRMLRYLEFQHELWADVTKQAAEVVAPKFVVWEPWGNVLDVPIKFDDVPNLVLSYHNYKGGLDIAEQPVNTINDSSIYARLLAGQGHPVILGEFGARDDLEQTRYGLPPLTKDTAFWHFMLLQATVKDGIIDGTFLWTYTNPTSNDVFSLAYNPVKDYAARNKGLVYESMVDVENKAIELEYARSPEVAVVMLSNILPFRTFLYLPHIDEALRRYNVDYDILWDFQLSQERLNKYKAIIVQTTDSANTSAFNEIVSAAQTKKVLLLGFNAGYNNGIQYNSTHSYLADRGLNMFNALDDVIRVPMYEAKGTNINEHVSEDLVVKRSWYDFEKGQTYPATLSRIYFDIAASIFQPGTSIILERAQNQNVALALKDNWLVYYNNGPLFIGDSSRVSSRIVDESDAFWKVVSSFLQWSGITIEEHQEGLSLVDDRVGDFVMESDRFGIYYKLSRNGASLIAPPATLTAHPREVLPGATLRLTGTNFEPSSTVSIAFDGNVATDLFTDHHGNFVTTVTVPNTLESVRDQSAKFRLYTVRAVDSSTNTNSAFTLIAVVPFPSLKVSSTNIKVGQEITVLGSLFSRDSQLTLKLDNQEAARLSANNAGSFQTKLTIPCDLAVGEHEIAITDENSRSASIGFTILNSGKCTVAPYLVMSPRSAERGSTITIWGNTFSSGSRVTLTLGDEKISTAKTNILGYFKTEARIPVLAQLGTQVITASDLNNRSASAPAIIYPVSSTSESLPITSLVNTTVGQTIKFNVAGSKAVASNYLQVLVDGTPVHESFASYTSNLSANLTDNLADQEPTFIVQVKDANGYVTYLDVKDGTALEEEEIVAFEWVTNNKGQYQAEIFVWTNVNNPLPLTRSPYMLTLDAN